MCYFVIKNACKSLGMVFKETDHETLEVKSEEWQL